MEMERAREADTEAERKQFQQEAAEAERERREHAIRSPSQEDEIVAEIDEDEFQLPNWRTPNSRAFLAIGVAVALLFLVPLFAYPIVRNSGLRSMLSKCETAETVNADAYYEGIFGKTIVFDRLEGGSARARRIDTVHLLMQFSGKLDFETVDRIVLARDGQRLFVVKSDDMQRMADSYDGGGRLWAFNQLPIRSRTMEGKQVFHEFTGGWLGVVKKETEQLNEFIEDWTGH
jgi:hypothetical protein